MSYQNASVYAVVGDETACTYYRMINPLKLLQKHGLNVSFGKGLDNPDAERAGVIFISRSASELVLDRIYRMGWRNVRIIYDIDDDFDHIEKSNPAAELYHGNNKKALQHVKDIMSICSGVITSTPELSKWYSHVNPNIQIMDNYIDFSLRDWGVEVAWDGYNPLFKPKPIKSKYPGTFTFGYSGSTSHLADFQLVAPSILKFLTNHPNARFLFNSNEKFFKLVMEAFKFPKNQVDFVPPVHFTNHPPLLQGIDVWLAPIICNQFNLCKTSLKLKETLAAGAVPIGSCVGNYARFHSQYNKYTILVGNNDFSSANWSQPLEWLYNNPLELDRIKNEGRKAMVQNESIEQHCHQWIKVVQNICEKVDQGTAWDKPKNIDTQKLMSYKSLGKNDKCPILPDRKYKNSYVGAFG